MDAQTIANLIKYLQIACEDANGIAEDDNLDIIGGITSNLEDVIRILEDEKNTLQAEEDALLNYFK